MQHCIIGNQQRKSSGVPVTSENIPVSQTPAAYSVNFKTFVIG